MTDESREDSGVIDLFAICQRPSLTPARDMTPPDLFSVAPPAFTTDVSDDDSLDVSGNPFSKGPFHKKLGFRVGAGAAGLGVLVVVIVMALGGKAEATKPSAASQLDAPAAATQAAPPPAAIASPVPVSSAAPIALPAPPTTGASSSVTKAPPRAAQPAPVAAKARAVIAAGPKMTKVQSGGVK